MSSLEDMIRRALIWADEPDGRLVIRRAVNAEDGRESYAVQLTRSFDRGHAFAHRDTLEHALEAAIAEVAADARRKLNDARDELAILAGEKGAP